MHRKIKILILLLSLFITNLYGQSINIAVAANVSYAIGELKEQFQKIYPNSKLRVTLGSSGKLTALIKNGAPYDLFISANMQYPQYLYDNGLTVDAPKLYAKGTLALFSSSKNDFTLGLDLLKNKSISKIAIANVKTAPYGKAALEVLNNSGLYGNVKHKLIYAESVSQTVSYAMTAADIGFIAASSLYSPKMKKFKKDIHWKEINSKLYTPIEQGIVLLKRSKGNQTALNFYNFMLSSETKIILKKYGYITP